MTKYNEITLRNYSNSKIDLNLERLKIALKLLNNPEKKLKFIHVAGTNGKGSACTMISHILKNSGYKTGLYISPHVTDYKERFQINNKNISNTELKEILDETKSVLSKLREENKIVLTVFELTTVIAFKYFCKNNCDIVVLETGLGGRLDATNVIENPVVSIITSISLDHTDFLGDNLEKIALEKSGIIKRHVPVICGPNIDIGPLSVIKNVAKKMESKFIVANISNVKVIRENFYETIFERDNKIFKLNLPGRHQIYNVCIVFECVELLKKLGYKILDRSIYNSLKEVSHPARLEILSKKPLIILDGAHNEEGIESLHEYISKRFSNKRIIGVFSMLKDKYMGTALSKILKLFSLLIVLKIENETRALPIKEVYNLAKKYNKNIVCKNNSEDAIRYLFSIINNYDVTIIFGSLYLAGKIRKLITY